MLRKITLLLSASMFVPQLKIHRWCVVEVPALGQQQYLYYWNFNVGPLLGQCQHANNDVLPTTPTITQRWPNDCLLSGYALHSFQRVNKNISYITKFLYINWFCTTTNSNIKTQVPSSDVITSLCGYSSVSEAWKVCVYMNGGASAIGDV